MSTRPLSLIGYWQALSSAERDAFAARAKTTRVYLAKRVFQDPPKVGATITTICRLADATEGAVTREQACKHWTECEPVDIDKKAGQQALRHAQAQAAA